MAGHHSVLRIMSQLLTYSEHSEQAEWKRSKSNCLYKADLLEFGNIYFYESAQVVNSFILENSIVFFYYYFFLVLVVAPQVVKGEL